MWSRLYGKPPHSIPVFLHTLTLRLSPRRRTHHLEMKLLYCKRLSTPSINKLKYVDIIISKIILPRSNLPLMHLLSLQTLSLVQSGSLRHSIEKSINVKDHHIENLNTSLQYIERFQYILLPTQDPSRQ